MSKPTRPRTRQLTRAQLKAYEARRTVEVSRTASPVPVASGSVIESRAAAAPGRIHMLSRAEEYAIIRSDLRRLLWILAVLSVVLVIMTIILR